MPRRLCTETAYTDNLCDKQCHIMVGRCVNCQLIARCIMYVHTHDTSQNTSQSSVKKLNLKMKNCNRGSALIITGTGYNIKVHRKGTKVQIYSTARTDIIKYWYK